MTAQNFTVEDADRLLGLADQFLEDWESGEAKSDPECTERRSEWDSIRPVPANAPRLLTILQDALLQSGYGITAPIPERDRYGVPAWIYSAREVIATIRGQQ
jgi:hypothetical protein